MHLTWKDGVSTLLVIAVVLVALAVVQDWGWPLLGSYRAGTVAIAILGLGMCALGGSTRTETFRGPFVATASVLGILALVFAVWALIADERAPFVALAVDTVLLWLVSTLHHALEAPTGRHAPAGT